MQPQGLRLDGATRANVAVEPRRPPSTNAGTKTAFGHDHCKPREHIQKVNISEVRGQLIRSNSSIFSITSIYMLSVTDFDPKGTISEVRVNAGAKFGHTGCWSIAKCRPELHRWISKLTARNLQILHQETF